MNTKLVRQSLGPIGQCAKHVALHLKTHPNIILNEIQIGIGTCVDNLPWAADLRRLDYYSAKRRNVARATNHLEATRFLYVWTAANALFSRDSIMSLLCKTPLPKGELDRFRILYNVASIPPASVQQYLAVLHTILEIPRSPQAFPWSTRRPLRVIDVIHWKYTPDSYKTSTRTAKKIDHIVCSGISTNSLDLPEIIYSARNWLVHGSLLDTSFRGNPSEFQEFICNLTEAVAIVIEQVAGKIMSAI